jgi:hypothetical protein
MPMQPGPFVPMERQDRDRHLRVVEGRLFVNVIPAQRDYAGAVPVLVIQQS